MSILPTPEPDEIQTSGIPVSASNIDDPLNSDTETSSPNNNVDFENLTQRTNIDIKIVDEILNSGRKTSTPDIAAGIENLTQRINLRILLDEHRTRSKLIADLKEISLFWLKFTILVILCHSIDDCKFTLSDSVMIAFLTTSLGTVLGLWGIGLGYYFFHQSSNRSPS